MDELVGMSKLSLGESIGDAGPSYLSLKLLKGSSRQSAFHANYGLQCFKHEISSSPGRQLQYNFNRDETVGLVRRK